MLVAIVGLRVEVLKLGSTVGTEVQQATALQSSNSALRAQISALSDNQRIVRLAEGYGMHMPDPLDVHFVQAAVGTHVAAAIRNITAPSNSTFLSGLATEQHASQQTSQAVAALNGAGTAATTGTSSTSTGTPSSTTASVSPMGTASSTGGTAPVGSGASVTAPANYAGTGGAASAGGAGTVAGGAGTGSAAVGTTAPGAAGGAAAGVVSGAASSSGAPAGPSQTPVSSGSTNGGTGLAG